MDNKLRQNYAFSRMPTNPTPTALFSVHLMVNQILVVNNDHPPKCGSDFTIITQMGGKSW